MSKNKEVFWSLKSENYGLITHVALTRKELVKKAEKGMGISWEELKKRGYSAVKVNMSEVVG